MTEKPILKINQLRVQISTPNGFIHAVDGVNLTLHRGEMFALVGESGCGKSMTAMSISRLLPVGAEICEGSEIFLDDIPLHQLSENKMRQIRGAKIGMIFQDPATALNPVLTIGEQVLEAIARRNGHIKSKKELQKEMMSLLEKVRLPSFANLQHQYPHQLSGGLKQRVVIAMALAQSPDLLIADEPTTALDVTTQAQVLRLIKDLNTQLNMAILLITHDLGIVAQMADRVAVMYAGHIIEESSKDEFIALPKHPYSRQLFSALPEYTHPGHQLAVIPGHVPSLDKTFSLCRFKDRCKYIFKPCEEEKPQLVKLNENHLVRCHWYDNDVVKTIPSQLRIAALIKQNEQPLPLAIVEDTVEEQEQPLLRVSNLEVHYPIRKGLFKRVKGYVKAVDDLTFNIYEGQTLALVGESGCGKTTVAKAILRLIREAKGKVVFQNKDIFRLSEKKLRKLRADFQMIFQDPHSSMDPRMRIRDIIEEGMLALNIGTDAKEREERIDVLLEQVGLASYFKERYPHELSGGQRQRVAIARALAVGASLIICDEPTSALDVSVQAQILNVLKALQNDLSISYLFITHNISVVHYLADYVAVMYLGRIVEYGPAHTILKAPKHPYTQALLASVPSVAHENAFLNPPKGELPSPIDPPKGCYFSPRCPKVHAPCLEKYPESYALSKDQCVSCYLYAPGVYKLKEPDSIKDDKEKQTSSH